MKKQQADSAEQIIAKQMFLTSVCKIDVERISDNSNESDESLDFGGVFKSNKISNKIG